MSKKSRDRAPQREADRTEAGAGERTRPTPIEPEPNRGNRPTVEELVGIDEGDPITEVLDEDEAITVDMDPIAAMIGVENLSEATFDAAPVRDGQKPGSPRDSLSIEPDELGAHFLKEAVQDARPFGDDFREGESEQLSAGEERMLDQIGVAREGALVTELPDGTAGKPRRPRARKSGERRASGARRAKNAV